MKKNRIFALILVACMFCTLLTGCGKKEEPVVAEETSAEVDGSKFESVLLKKGSAIIKHFEPAGEIKGDEDDSFYDINLEAATLTDLETGSKYQAIRMSHLDLRTVNYNYGIIDSDEIDGAISTLEYIKAHKDEMTDYTEIIYTANSGFKIGAYKDSIDAKICFIFTSTDKEYMSFDMIDNIISTLRSAQDMLGK